MGYFQFERDSERFHDAPIGLYSTLCFLFTVLLGTTLPATAWHPFFPHFPVPERERGIDRSLIWLWNSNMQPNLISYTASWWCQNWVRAELTFEVKEMELLPRRWSNHFPISTSPPNNTKWKGEPLQSSHTGVPFLPSLLCGLHSTSKAADRLAEPRGPWHSSLNSGGVVQPRNISWHTSYGAGQNEGLDQHQTL